MYMENSTVSDLSFCVTLRNNIIRDLDMSGKKIMCFYTMEDIGIDFLERIGKSRKLGTYHVYDANTLMNSMLIGKNLINDKVIFINNFDKLRNKSDVINFVLKSDTQLVITSNNPFLLHSEYFGCLETEHDLIIDYINIDGVFLNPLRLSYYKEYTNSYYRSLPDSLRKVLRDAICNPLIRKVLSKHSYSLAFRYDLEKADIETLIKSGFIQEVPNYYYGFIPTNPFLAYDLCSTSLASLGRKVSVDIGGEAQFDLIGEMNTFLLMLLNSESIKFYDNLSHEFYCDDKVYTSVDVRTVSITDFNGNKSTVDIDDMIDSLSVEAVSKISNKLVRSAINVF